MSDVRSAYANFVWWAVVYMFFCIIGVMVVVASDSTQTYHVAVRTDPYNFSARLLTVFRLWASWPLALS